MPKGKTFSFKDALEESRNNNKISTPVPYELKKNISKETNSSKELKEATPKSDETENKIEMKNTGIDDELNEYNLERQKIHKNGQKVHPQTLKSQTKSWSCFRQYTIGKHKVDVKTEHPILKHYEDYLQSRIDKGINPNTLRVQMAHIKSVHISKFGNKDIDWQVIRKMFNNYKYSEEYFGFTKSQYMPLIELDIVRLLEMDFNQRPYHLRVQIICILGLYCNLTPEQSAMLKWKDMEKSQDSSIKFHFPEFDSKSNCEGCKNCKEDVNFIPANSHAYNILMSYYDFIEESMGSAFISRDSYVLKKVHGPNANVFNKSNERIFCCRGRKNDTFGMAANLVASLMGYEENTFSRTCFHEASIKANKNEINDRLSNLEMN